MNVLVTGSTGTIGSLVVSGLAAQGASVHALTREPAKASFPAGVTAVKGDMTDVASMRAALKNVDTLFLLNAVVADEVTQAISTLSLAREAGIQRIVYLSVLNSDAYTDVPHFTGKYTVERMIEQFDLPVTVLRPSYFMQNDAMLRDGLLKQGRYGMPIGNVGVSMVDVRDIAEIAVASLLRRARAPSPLPREVIEITGAEALTGEALATIWSGVLGKPVTYGGNDLDAYEGFMAGIMPSWSAYDLRLMLGRFHTDGMLGKSHAVDILTGLLGHP
ncbi:MAG: NmrA/HSCARG family protein, partial [Pseudomonadota bacterium]|nr:NmrA/HSCARG family protein [Pseudomonadota bacterium]